MHFVREPPTCLILVRIIPFTVESIGGTWAKVLKEKVLADAWLMFAYGSEIKSRAPLDKGLWKGFQGIGRLNF